MVAREETKVVGKKYFQQKMPEIEVPLRPRYSVRGYLISLLMATLGLVIEESVFRRFPNCVELVFAGSNVLFCKKKFQIKVMRR